MKPRDRLRIAMQKSGRLTEPALELLARCGLTFRQSRDKLFCFGESVPVDLLLVRDDDIPGLIAEGVCDLGIVGRNVLSESGSTHGARRANRSASCVALGFGRCRLVDRGAAGTGLPRAATAAGPAHRDLVSGPARRMVAHARRSTPSVVTLAGSVEIAPRLGTADAICDLVSERRHAGGEPAARSRCAAGERGGAGRPADAAGGRARRPAGTAAAAARRRDPGARVAACCCCRRRAHTLDAITRLLPGGPQPTLLAVDGQPDQLTLQALCAGEMTWQQLEDMKKAGARELLVLPVEKMLA